MNAGTGAGWARVVAWGVACGLAGLLSACGGGAEPIEAHAARPSDSQPTTAKSPPSGLVRVSLPVTDWAGDAGQHVGRNTSEWASTWAVIQSLEAAAPPLAGVDFNQHMLVGVTDAYGGCSGSIAITHAALETAAQGSEWVVHFQLRDTGAPPGTLCSDDMKPVADFILLPQSALPVRFIELPRLH